MTVEEQSQNRESKHFDPELEQRMQDLLAEMMLAQAENNTSEVKRLSRLINYIRNSKKWRKHERAGITMSGLTPKKDQNG